MREKNCICTAFIFVFLAFSLAAPAAMGAPNRRSELGYLSVVNGTRVAHGLRPLRLDPRLQSAAREHSAAMLRSDTFAHGNFVGRMLAVHVFAFAGENLAWGSGYLGSPRAVVDAWLKSPEHRRNLLRPGFRRIGIGLARGTFLGYGGATVVTADFAR